MCPQFIHATYVIYIHRREGAESVEGLSPEPEAFVEKMWSCLCARDPFLENSRHYTNREDFSLALRRNESYQFFSGSMTEGTAPGPVPVPLPSSEFRRVRFFFFVSRQKLNKKVEVSYQLDINQQKNPTQPPTQPHHLSLQQNQRNTNGFDAALSRCHDMFVEGAPDDQGGAYVRLESITTDPKPRLASGK